MLWFPCLLVLNFFTARFEAGGGGGGGRFFCLIQNGEV